MNWQKQGLVYAPNGEFWWAKSYAHLPTATIVNDRTIRVFFAALDQNMYGRIGYLDLDSHIPNRVLFVAREPSLDLGEPGTFDDCGVNPSCILDIDGQKYLYYIGWQRCQRTPYMLFSGLARSDDGVKFIRTSRTPVLDRTGNEPFLRSAPTILRENAIFRAWYVSGLEWTIVNGVQYPSYIIRYAESTDGVIWKAYKHICFNFESDNEFGFGRPWVVHDGDVYKMWYSIRSRNAPYRIGYAESLDGLNWTRMDHKTGMERSAEGWDSEMICYPCVGDFAGKRYMFYNGNRHGATGFGYAVWGE